MEIDLMLILAWAIIMTITLGILVIFLIKLQQKHENDKRSMVEDFTKKIKKSLEGQRSSVKGKAWEQMAPFFPEFTAKYSPSDSRFLGTPIDYVVFKNMSKFDKKAKDENPIEIVLVEIKTGKTKKLTDLEDAIKKAIESKRVSFEQIDLPDEKII
jgi:predicted Holliday junction resolvase-like endonuclease